MKKLLLVLAVLVFIPAMASACDSDYSHKAGGNYDFSGIFTGGLEEIFGAISEKGEGSWGGFLASLNMGHRRQGGGHNGGHNGGGNGGAIFNGPGGHGQCAVPTPSSVLVLGSGLLGLVAVGRRRLQ